MSNIEPAMLKEHRLPPVSGGNPKQAVIFLHGLGDSGTGGLLSIGQIWRQSLTDCEFLCPDAPFAYDMAPPDFGGRQWFSLNSFDKATILAGAKMSAPHLNDYIDHVLTTRKLTPDKIALVGFSQGTMMALYVAPRRDRPLCCIVGYSGLLIGGETLMSESISKPPVLLVHGEADDVVPFAAMAEAESTLRAAGFSVETLACRHTPHTIDDAGLIAGLRFIHAQWNN